MRVAGWSLGVWSVAALWSGAALLAHDPIGTRVTWDREISPIVQARCVSCHRDGGRAPMALATYEQARPWARAIREEVLARRMPKWHVVRGYGDFVNDPSLSPFEIALITSWVDGGAPKTLPAKPTVPFAAGARQDMVRPAARELTLPCGTRVMPPGRLVGLRPQLPPGAALRVDLTQDGLTHPLLWVKDFDPDFRETYWLRTPIQVSRATRLSASGPEPCAVSVLLESGKAR